MVGTEGGVRTASVSGRGSQATGVGREQVEAFEETGAGVWSKGHTYNHQFTEPGTHVPERGPSVCVCFRWVHEVLGWLLKERQTFGEP